MSSPAPKSSGSSSSATSSSTFFKGPIDEVPVVSHSLLHQTLRVGQYDHEHLERQQEQSCSSSRESHIVARTPIPADGVGMNQTTMRKVVAELRRYAETKDDLWVSGAGLQVPA